MKACALCVSSGHTIIANIVSALAVDCIMHNVMFHKSPYEVKKDTAYYDA